MNTWHLYIRNGRAYVPTIAQTDAGFFIETEPVTVISIEDRTALIDSVAKAIAAGNPLVRTPARHEYSAPVVAKAAGVKSWTTFEKAAQCFAVHRLASGYEIAALKRASDGCGWVEGLQSIAKLPSSCGLKDAACALVEAALTATTGTPARE